MAATAFAPANLALGAGILYTAPIGSTEPTDVSTAWDAAWTLLGATSDGHTFTYDLSMEAIFIAEEVMPVRAEASKLQPMIEFTAAEMTAKMWQLAMNGGTIVTGGSAATLTPPNANLSPGEKMIGWQSLAADERYVWRRCVQMKGPATKRNKAPQIAEVPMSWGVLRPLASTPLATVAPFLHILSTARG